MGSSGVATFAAYDVDLVPHPLCMCAVPSDEDQRVWDCDYVDDLQASCFNALTRSDAYSEASAD